VAKRVPARKTLLLLLRVHNRPLQSQSCRAATWLVLGDNSKTRQTLKKACLQSSFVSHLFCKSELNPLILLSQPAGAGWACYLFTCIHGHPAHKTAGILSPTRCKDDSTPVLFWGLLGLLLDISACSLRMRGISHYFLHSQCCIAYPSTENYSLHVLHEKH